MFLNRLDDIIKTLYKIDLQFIICGDINIDYLTDNDKKKTTWCSASDLQFNSYSIFPHYSIFSCNGNIDTDTLFNLFHNNYLRIFYSSFPSQKIIERSNNNSRLTPGIRISCKCKRCLYLLTKDSDDVIFKNYYKQYWKTVTSVIKEAKKYMYNNRIINSTSKMRQLGIL